MITGNDALFIELDNVPPHGFSERFSIRFNSEHRKEYFLAYRNHIFSFAETEVRLIKADYYFLLEISLDCMLQ